MELSESAGAVIHNNTAVVDVALQDTDTNNFVVTTDTDAHTTRNVIICVGGQSYPGCGTTGDGYEWARAFGHEIKPPLPSLTPIVTGDQWSRELSGVTIPDCTVSVVDAASRS